MIPFLSFLFSAELLYLPTTTTSYCSWATVVEEKLRNTATRVTRQPAERLMEDASIMVSLKIN